MQDTTMDELGGEDAKRHAPATLRNREAILDVLRRELPERGTILEIASGSGEHAVFFAEQLSGLAWQPSDPDPDALQSIAAWRKDHGGSNLLAPLQLDASAPEWPVERNGSSIDAIVCINMVHISPWAASEGLFAGAERLLGEDAPLVLYGPYLETDVETAASNLAFDQSLKARDLRWGLRRVEDMDALAHQHGLARSARHEMPANNIMLVYRRQS